MKYKVGDKVKFAKECTALVTGDVIPVNSVWEVKSDLDEYYRIELADKQLVAMIERKVAEDCCEKINTAPSITKRINDKHHILNGLLNSDGSIDGEKLMKKLEESQVQVANGVVMNDRPQRPTESASTPQNDLVNHPSHYTDGKIEVIDFIEDKKLSYHLGNACKYICRCLLKNGGRDKIQDLCKAKWYIERQIYIWEKEGES
jgi:hypothetical protein